jgi:hypothetical protein
MSDSKFYQKPESEMVYKEIEVPFEIIYMPEKNLDEVFIDDNKELVKRFLEEKKLKITPKNSFIEINLDQHFG